MRPFRFRWFIFHLHVAHQLLRAPCYGAAARQDAGALITPYTRRTCSRAMFAPGKKRSAYNVDDEIAYTSRPPTLPAVAMLPPHAFAIVNAAHSTPAQLPRSSHSVRHSNRRRTTNPHHSTALILNGSALFALARADRADRLPMRNPLTLQCIRCRHHQTTYPGRGGCGDTMPRSVACPEVTAENFNNF